MFYGIFASFRQLVKSSYCQIMEYVLFGVLKEERENESN